MPQENEQIKSTVPAQKPSKKKDDGAAYDRECRVVGDWVRKIRSARERFEPDFDRMRDNMKFARGLQWNGQERMDDPKYVCNLVLRAINQGVALLYAKNPECESIRRDRMDFTMWDGKMETLQQAQMQIMQAQQMGMQPPPLAIAMVKDWMDGETWRDLVERVGKTVKLCVQYMMDSNQPNFKLQMKQLVRRVKTCAVGFVKVNYDDGFEQSISTSETESTLVDRMQRIKEIAERFEKGELTEDSPELEQLRYLGNSIEASAKTGDTQNVNQRITYDFLPASAVIVDPSCRHLKGFVGAKWLAVEHLLDLNYINAKFECQIPGDKVKRYNATGQEATTEAKDYKQSDSTSRSKACLWEVFDLVTKSSFWIVDGYDKFVEPPGPVMPETNHFWPIVALTFNDIEAAPDGQGGCQSIYPPSDVDLMRSPQKEWNRTREALKNHRVANTPCYLTGKGWLTDNDKDKISNHEDSAVVELEGAQLGTDIAKLLAPFQHAPIEPMLYDTGALNQDIQFSTGEQDANLGRPSPKVTATGATIAEQAKNSVAASNIDDLDDFLGTLAQISGEIVLRYFSLETCQRVAGRGAVLPQQNREDFINEIFLSVKAASSGRPNQAVDISNFERIGPLLVQAGANPLAVIEEGVKRLDPRLDISKFFPQPGMMGATAPQQQPVQGQNAQSHSQQPGVQQLPNQAATQSI